MRNPGDEIWLAPLMPCIDLMKVKRTLAGAGGSIILAAMLAGCGTPRENGTLIGTGVGAAGGAVVGSAVGHPLARGSGRRRCWWRDRYAIGNHEQHEDYRYYHDGY